MDIMEVVIFLGYIFVTV